MLYSKVGMDSLDCFKVYVDQLHGGHIAKIDEAVSSAFLGVQEVDLTFRDPVQVKGEAYLAGDELLLHLALHAVSIVPCVICNTPIDVVISLPNVYEAVPLEEIPHGVFSIQNLVREAILLEAKSFAECNNGKCPQRGEISVYLKKEKPAEEPHSPFDDLKSSDFEV